MSGVDPLRAELLAEQELDRRQCARDPEFFLETHCKIEDPDGTVIPFRLWPAQRKTIQTLVEHELAVVLKARRLGISWVALALALWMAIYQQGVRILVLCKTESDASELLDRIRRMRDRIELDPLSAHLLAGLERPGKTRNAVTTLDIGTSTIRALVGTPAAARSETAGLVIWDEAAFQTRAEQIWQGLLPTIEGGGKLWIISTGNGTRGQGAMFADIWQRAVKGLSSFRHLFWPWDARPDRTPEWKRQQVAALGSVERFRVEYPEQPDDAFIVADATSVYSRAGIAAAVRLGQQYDALRAAGALPPPVGGAVDLCADFGEQAHVLTLWPLERGGIYVVSEHYWSHADSDAEAEPVVAQVKATGWPLAHFRFDNSMPRDAKLFCRVLRPGLDWWDRWTPVAFNRHKRGSILYLRWLFNRTAQGEETGVIAISPSCDRLIAQLEGLRFKDDETELVVKLDDHGPDALVAGVAPLAKRHWATVEQAAANT